LILIFVFSGALEAKSSAKSKLEASKALRPPLVEVHKVGRAQLEIEPKPFWKKKKKLFQKITEERDIVVTANVPTYKVGEKEVYNFNIDAVGLVSAPLLFSSDIVWNLEELPKVNDAFKEVKYFPKYQRVFIHISSMGFWAKMILQLSKKVNKGVDEMHFEVVEGSFLGMKGVVRLKSLGLSKTLVSLKGRYESTRLPLPKSLMGFGLEILARGVAKSLREHMETTYQN